MSNFDPRAEAIFELICKRLDAAETAFSAGLRRLSALDAEVVAMSIERARTILETGHEAAHATIELQRRMLALRIEAMRRGRATLEAECDAYRSETRRLLRQKIALEGALSAAKEEARRKERNQ